LSGGADAIPAFPFARTTPLDPPPIYATLRAESPITRARLWDGSVVWLITRYDDVRAVLSDNRFSALSTDPGYPSLSAARKALLRNERSFIFRDPPEHTHFRRMVTREFTVRRVEEMRPRIEQIVDALLDKMIARGAPADYVEAFAAPLPAMVIFEMLGVPDEDQAFFQARSDTRGTLTASPEAAVVAGREMSERLSALFEKAEASAAAEDTIIARLVRDYIRPGVLARADAVDMARLIVMAGHETTTNMIALGTVTLLEHPEQLAALCADPSLMRNAVEELLRYLTILHYTSSRVAREDVTIDGQTIRAGDGVFALLSAANRDPAAFARPEKLDFGCPAGHQVAFGFGVHQCLGQSLARAELQIVFARLFDRLPRLRLAVPLHDVRFKREMNVYGVHALPVAW
jgi:cytochrome P450